jgi:lysine 6-dehydrogenase
MKRTFFVIGGAGAMGRVVVRDLFESHPQNRVVVADYNLAAARTYAASFRSRRITSCFADANRPRKLAELLRGYPVVVNCTQHEFNLSVMRAALLAGAHYLDLGGLFVWTRRQLRLHAEFKRAGLTAILGMGGSPGITNVMARAAADRLERVGEIRVRSGWASFAEPDADLSFGFSAQTVIEELTLPPWIYTGGRFCTVPPRSRWEEVRFARPVGRVSCLCTRHSEVATLPDSFREKGCRACDFKLGYDRAFVREIVRRLHAGWTVADFRKLPASRERVDDFEVLRVIVKGRRPDGQRAVLTVDCESRSKPAWKASAGDINTGCPPSIVAQMMLDGRLPLRPGVWPPERIVPFKSFSQELAQRGLRIVWRRG